MATFICETQDADVIKKTVQFDANWRRLNGIQKV
jgi:hypothetical protein